MTDVSKKAKTVRIKLKGGKLVIGTPKEKLKKFAEKGIKIAYQGAQLLSALKNNGIEINLIKIVQAEKAPQPLPLMKDTRDR